MGDDFSHAHAACLASQLPRGARCRVVEDPYEEWDESTWLLWHIEHSTRVSRWASGITYRGEGTPPQQLDYPGAKRDRIAAETRFRETKQKVNEAFGIEE